MCLEGIRLGRKMEIRTRSVTIATTSSEIIPADASRVSIIFPVPVTNAYWVIPGVPAAQGTGQKLHATGHELKVFVEQWGQFAMAAWNGLSEVAQQTVTVFEVYFRQE